MYYIMWCDFLLKSAHKHLQIRYRPRILISPRSGNHLPTKPVQIHVPPANRTHWYPTMFMKQKVTPVLWDCYLVCGFNPSEKYLWNWIISPGKGWTWKNFERHHLVIIHLDTTLCVLEPLSNVLLVNSPHLHIWLLHGHHVQVSPLKVGKVPAVPAKAPGATKFRPTESLLWW